MQIDVILDTRARASELAELGRLAERHGIGACGSRASTTRGIPSPTCRCSRRQPRRCSSGPIAVNPFDTHPLKIAAAFLTLNELARGRARIVIGGGGEALQALGLAPLRRVRAVRECVQIIKAARTGQPVNFEGEIYKVRNCRFGWVECATATGLRRCGPAADAAHGGCRRRRHHDERRAARARRGRHRHAGCGAVAAHGKTRPAFWTSVFTAWHVYDDEAEARREAKRWLLLRGIFRPWLLAEFLEPADVDLVMRSRRHSPGHSCRAATSSRACPIACSTRWWTTSRCAERRRKLDGVDRRSCAHSREAGLGGVALRLYANPAESIRLIGEHVMPASGARSRELPRLARRRSFAVASPAISSCSRAVAPLTTRVGLVALRVLRMTSARTDQFLQPAQGVVAILLLAAMLLRLDDDHAVVGEAPVAQREDALLESVGERRGADVEAQVDRR